MKRILTIFLLAFTVLSVGLSAEAKTTTKKKAKTTQSSKSSANLTVYCDPVDLMQQLNLPVEKVTIYLNSRKVKVKLSGKSQETVHSIDWIDDQYGDAACIYFPNGGFVSIDIGAGELVYAPKGIQMGYYDIVDLK